MPDISRLADKAARLWRAQKIRIPAAVWKVLRAEKLAERPDAREIAGDICAALQTHATARRKKNKRLGQKSPSRHEQLELPIDPRHEEARQMAFDRGDHLLPDP